MNYRHTLDKRLALIFIISTGLMTLFQGAATNWFIRGEIEKWQLEELDNSKSVTINLIRNRFDSLETLTLDYAIWQSTYNYIESYKNEDTKPFFREKDLPTSNLAATLLLDSSNKIISASSVEHLIDKNALKRGFLSNVVKGEDKGLIFDGTHIYQYIKREVYATAQRTDTNGFIVFFREFTQKDVNDIIHDVGTNFSLKVDKRVSTITRYSLKEFATPTLKQMDKNDLSIVAEYEYIINNNEKLPVNLVIEIERKLNSLMKTEILLVTQVFGLCLVACLMMFQLRKIVVQPIIQMSKHLAAQELANNQYQPLKLKNSSEIGYLANNIDQLFHRVAEQHQFNQMLLDSNEDIILTVNNENKITHANPAAQKWFQQPEQALQNVDINFALTSVAENNHSLIFYINKTLAIKQKFTVELTLRNNFLPNVVHDVELNCFHLEGESANDNSRDGQALLIIRLSKQ